MPAPDFITPPPTATCTCMSVAQKTLPNCCQPGVGTTKSTGSTSPDSTMSMGIECGKVGAGPAGGECCGRNCCGRRLVDAANYSVFDSGYCHCDRALLDAERQSHRPQKRCWPGLELDQKQRTRRQSPA